MRKGGRTDYVTFDFFTTYSANSLMQGMLKYQNIYTNMCK